MGVGSVITRPHFSFFVEAKNEGDVSVKGRYMRTKFGYTTRDFHEKIYVTSFI